MTPSDPRWVKICGITNPADAELCAAAGANAIGLNFVSSSLRRVGLDAARQIANAIRGRVELVGVFADESKERLQELQAELGLDWLQLHGAEPEALVASLPRAYKACRVGSRADLVRAFGYPGDRVLLDALVPGTLGGTGARFDWNLLDGQALPARWILAGGLTPDTVRDAIQKLRPFGVDVASGVELEGEPRRKHPEKIVAFVRAVQRSG